VRFPLILILFVLLMAVSAAQGQQTSAAGAASAAAGVSPIQSLPGVESPIISDMYYLAPGDRLLVTVQGSVAYSYEALVSYEGKVNISIPIKEDMQEVIDVVPVSGLTLAAAQDTLSAAMGRYFKTARVKLTLIGLRSGIVFLTGEVRYPGAYDALPVERVSQIIAQAGGLAPLGSRTHIKLVRNGEVHSIVDIERFERSGDLLANPFVQSGDVVQVPRVEGAVTVKGAVFGRGEYRLRAPTKTYPDVTRERLSEGIYELSPGERVTDVIDQAGGITPWADLSHSYIERLVVGGDGERKRIPVDLRGIMFDQDSASNIDVANADIVVVPPFDTLVYVEGELNKPGPFPFVPGLRASDYIGQAGGPTNYANVLSAHVRRSGKRISISGRSNPVVEPGDIVVVPRVGVKWWQDYITIFGAVAVPIASLLVSLSIAGKF
jgi:polysaccharide export outer membrane protein